LLSIYCFIPLALRQQIDSASRLKYEQEFTLNKFEKRLKGILTEIAK